MRIKLTGETARAYVRELGGSLEVAHDSEGPYFMAEDQHPDHKAILERIKAEAAAQPTPQPWHIEARGGRFEIWPEDKGEPHGLVAVVQREADARAVVLAAEALAACQAVFAEMGKRLSPAAFDEFTEETKDLLRGVVLKAAKGAE